jgi:hypothetical protein
MSLLWATAAMDPRYYVDTVNGRHRFWGYAHPDDLPRGSFDGMLPSMSTERFDRLIPSVQEKGVTHHIKVHDRQGDWRIEEGNHRKEVARHLGLDRVPVEVSTDKGEPPSWLKPWVED